jgi:uncharacterized membrane protein
MSTRFSETAMAILRRALSRLFIDSLWPHRCWDCHRLPDRSFSLEGRQFHVCARCTGVVLGLLGAPALLAVRHELVLLAFVLSLLALAVDGMTQLAGWRTSTNPIRFGTGFLAASLGPSAVIYLIGLTYA